MVNAFVAISARTKSLDIVEKTRQNTEPTIAKASKALYFEGV